MTKIQKIFLIAVFILIVLYIFLSPQFFFWGYYIEQLGVFIISIVFFVITILGLLQYIISMKRDKSSEYLTSYIKEHKRKKIAGFIIVLITCCLTIMFSSWLFSITYKEVISLSKDIPNVLNKSYIKVECYVISSKTSSQKGDHYSQTVTIQSKLDNSISIVRFMHDYKKIESFNYYSILFLPNSKLGVNAVKK